MPLVAQHFPTVAAAAAAPPWPSVGASLGRVPISRTVRQLNHNWIHLAGSWEWLGWLGRHTPLGGLLACYAGWARPDVWAPG
eukprot:gene4048-10667_t